MIYCFPLFSQMKKMSALIPSIISFISYVSKVVIRRHSVLHDVHKCIIPIPKTPHLTLGEKEIKGRTLFIIGDVHGCFDELNDLLDKVNKKLGGTDKYLPIFVGDLVNKGPKSIEALRKIRSIEHYAVRGNHDAAAYRERLMMFKHNDYNPPQRWQWVKQLDNDDIDYLKEIPYTISIPTYNAIIVHAGLVPNIPLQDQSIKDMIIMRNLVLDDDTKTLKSAELPKDGHPWASLWPGPQKVYFGHDAKRKLQEYPFALGLDTGCLYGFLLTGVILNENGTEELLQVQARNVYEKPVDG